MKTILILAFATIIASVAFTQQRVSAGDTPRSMTCTVLGGKTAIEIGTATAEEVDRGDIPLRCVLVNGSIVYHTIPHDEYEWRGCQSEFKLPEKFFGILHGAQFATNKCAIYQRRECTAAELAAASCGERLPLQSIPCRPPR